MSLTQQLADLREKRHVTLAVIGSLVGMAVPNLSAVFRGRGDSRTSTVEALATALDAEWVLVPKEHLHEVRQVIEGKGTGPDRTARGAIDIFLSRKS